jgi:hypothetical protein
MTDIEKEILWHLIVLAALAITYYDCHVVIPRRHRKYIDELNKRNLARIMEIMNDPKWQASMQKCMELHRRKND